MPWKDCAGLINGPPNWVFWHHWPDSKVHEDQARAKVSTR